ncbi:hypothetical protein L1I30_00240 [Gillisia sp. M10.2A]|uniref:Uncharacterized protein n=1 Tax=Gillisia lutea TaxID=2909668 RepID=A0ABS9EB58_9FLAO|nr:hypothetical protein [Gillisia lutea]MCF4100082.1 hypothetical protein [Gillisia lutea]
MATINHNRAKKIYWILLILAVVIGFLVYGIFQEQFSLKFLVIFSGVPFLLFVTGLFGMLWPAIKPTGDTSYISHAIIAGIIFLIMFVIHTWVILPRICPDFGKCLGI